MLVSCKARSSRAAAKILQYKKFTNCTASLQAHRASACKLPIGTCVLVSIFSKYGCVRSSAELCKPAASVDVVRQQQTCCSSVTNACMPRQTDRQIKSPASLMCTKVIVIAGVPGAVGHNTSRTQTALSPPQWTEQIHRTPMCMSAMCLQTCQRQTSGSISANLVALRMSRYTGKVRALSYLHSILS